MDKKDNFDSSFEEFYKEYFVNVLRYVYSSVNDLYLSEDITHDIFLRIYKNKNIPSGSNEKVKAYLFKAAKNMIIDYYRLEQKEQKKQEIVLVEWDFVDLDVSEIIIEGEVLSTISDVIESFPFRERNIFYQRFYGKKIKDISKEHNISRYHIKRIEDKILQRIRDTLQKNFAYNSNFKEQL